MLPKNTKVVYSGILFNIRQWEQLQFDGSTKTYELATRPDSTIVIAEFDKEIAIAHQSQAGTQPYISLFGGHLETDEDALGNAKKELEEEAGLVSDHWEKLGVIDRHFRVFYKIHVFIARHCTQTKQKLEPGERITVKYVSVEQFISMLNDNKFYEGGLIKELFQNGVTLETKKKIMAQFDY